MLQGGRINLVAALGLDCIQPSMSFAEVQALLNASLPTAPLALRQGTVSDGLTAPTTTAEPNRPWVLLDSKLTRNTNTVLVSCVVDQERDGCSATEAEASLLHHLRHLFNMSAPLSATPAADEDVEDATVAATVPELVLSAPCRVPLLSACLHDYLIDSAEPHLVQAAANLLQHSGLAVLPSCAPLQTLDRLGDQITQRIAAIDAALALRNLADGQSSFQFREVASRGPHRYDLLLESSPELQSLTRSADSPWLPIVEQVLGPRFDVDISVVYSRPGAPNQEWHADGPHLGASADWNNRGVAAPYAMCVFVPLMDLSEEVGFTQFWPGTHLHEQLIGFGPACPVLDCQVDGIVPRGSAVMYDYRTLHRGMGNRSAATERRVLQLLYRLPTYTEQRNYGKEALLLPTNVAA